MDSKGSKVPVSESYKLDESVLGYRFSENTEHLPIKKRRFLFRASSPPLDTAPLDHTDTVSIQEVQPKPDESCLPAASSTVADLHESGSSDSKVDEKELVKAEDVRGISLVAVPACSNRLGSEADLCEGSGIASSDAKSLEAPSTVKSEENSAEETDSHISASPSKDFTFSIMDHSSPDKATFDNSTPDESTLDNSCSQVPSESECSRMNQVTTARDERLNWDLNTIMDVWEEPVEGEHGVSAADAACCNNTYAEEEKYGCKEGRYEGCELGRENGSASENICNEVLPADLKSLAHIVEESKLEEFKPNCSIDAIPVVSSTLTLDCSPHPGLNQCIDMCAKEESVDVSSTIVGSQDNVNHGITTIQKATENEKHNLSLATATFLENGVHQSGSVLKKNDDDEVKDVISSNGITMANLVSKGTDLSQETYNGACKAVNQSGNTFKENDEDEVKIVISSNGITMENLVSKGTDLTQETYNGDCKAMNQSGRNFKENDEDEVKKVISSNGITMENLVSKGTDLSQETYNRDCKAVNPTKAAAVSSMPIKTEESPLMATSEKPMMLLTGTVYHTDHESHTVYSNDIVSCNKEACELPSADGFGYENLQSDIQAGSEVDNVDDLSVEYPSQYEDGELRESSIQMEGTSLNLDPSGAHDNSSLCVPESSSRARSVDVGSQKGADEISCVLLPEKVDSSDQVSGSEPNDASNGAKEVSMKDTTQSDQWKMNVSGWDILPENHNTMNNATTIRDLSGIKFSSRVQRYGPENEDVDTKVEGSRFYRRESIRGIGGPPARDVFLNRGRLHMQGSSDADDSTLRPVRDSSGLRSLRRGKYTPHIPANSRRSGMWNRSMMEDVPVDNLTNETRLDPNENGSALPDGSSFITRQSFRSRLPMNREEDDFRARLGLRPSGDTSHNRSVNVGRGRPMRYSSSSSSSSSSRHDGGGPRGRYHGPVSGEYNEPLMEYSHPFPTRSRCFSPIERREREIHPSRSRTRSPINDGFRRHTSRSRSRSPNFRSDVRIRRPRSPNYRIGFEADHWVNYKQRSSAFDRRSPDRFSFYDPSRKPKPNENYSRGGPGYLGSDGEVADHGYRRGGFVRPYEMGRPVKRFQYDEDDGYGPVYDSHEKDGLEFHGRVNPRPYSNGTDRFRELPRRPREDRENW